MQLKLLLQTITTDEKQHNKGSTVNVTLSQKNQQNSRRVSEDECFETQV